MLKNRVENQKNERYSPDLKSSFQKINNKALFSLDKIKQFINKRNYTNSLFNSDERLTNLKNLSKKKLKKINHSSQKIINEKISSEDKINKMNSNLKIFSIKNIANILSRNKIISLKHQRSVNDLPNINIQTPNKKLLELLYSKSKSNIIKSEKSKNFLFPNDIMDSKDLYKNRIKVIKIASFLNNQREKELFLENQKILDINEMNSKYNLNLNLRNMRHSKIFKGKRYTILGMLNKLYHYYSSNSNNDIAYKLIIKDNYPNSRNFDNNDLFDSNTFTELKNVQTQKNIFEKNKFNTINTNINSDYSNTFLTKLDEKNNCNHKKISKLDIAQLNRNLEIIKKNSKININWLNSRNGRGITAEKILYKYLERSLCAYGDDPSYHRIKKLNKNINKLLKNDTSF